MCWKPLANAVCAACYLKTLVTACVICFHQIHLQQQLLTLYAERASLHEHHASAVLVQQLIVPANIGGQKNPLHACFDKVKEAGRRDINRGFTATAERAPALATTDHGTGAACRVPATTGDAANPGRSFEPGQF